MEFGMRSLELGYVYTTFGINPIPWGCIHEDVNSRVYPHTPRSAQQEHCRGSKRQQKDKVQVQVYCQMSMLALLTP